MGTKTPEKILYDSDESARLETVQGWVSRDGLFFGNKKGAEHSARWSGCTHLKCVCGAEMTKQYTKCPACRHKSMVERYEALESVLWDEETPVCEYDGCKFFFGLQDLLDYIDNDDIDPDETRLVLCEPTKPNELEASEFLCDYLPEDSEGDLSEEIHAAAEAFNKAVIATGPLAWVPSKKRVDIRAILGAQK